MLSSYTFNTVKNKIFTNSFVDMVAVPLKIMLVKLEMFDDLSIPSYQSVEGYIESNYEITSVVGDNHRTNGYERRLLENVKGVDIVNISNITSLLISSDDIIWQTDTGIDAGGAIVYSEVDNGVTVTITPIVALNFNSKKSVDSGNFIVPLSDGFLRLE